MNAPGRLRAHRRSLVAVGLALVVGHVVVLHAVRARAALSAGVLAGAAGLVTLKLLGLAGVRLARRARRAGG